MATSDFSKSRNLLARKRLQRRSSVRRALLESLEDRQLLAVGPQLLGIQPNTGDLLQSGDVLNVSPKELVFRFDDTSGIDPSTLDGIRIIRSGDDGVFERASAATDFGTGGQTLVEFYAAEAGEAGNGIQIVFTSQVRNDGRAPNVSVDGRVVNVELNANPTQETRVEDLLQAFDPATATPVTSLVTALRLRGSQTVGIASTGAPRTLTLTGANSAKASTNFNLSNNLEVRFIAKDSGNEGLGITISVTARDRGGSGNPIVTVSGKAINVEINSDSRFPTTVQEFVDAINASDSLSSSLVEARLVSGIGATRLGTAPITYSPIELSGVSDVEIIPAYVGLGDTDREVVMRFAEALPDDNYRIEIIGQGGRTLRNVAGEAFDCGISKSIAFSLDLGAQIESIVPQPVTRNGNLLVQARNEIDVYFNDDELIDLRSIAQVNGLTLSQLRDIRTPLFFQTGDGINFNTSVGNASVLDPSFYQLFHTNDTLDSSDDTRVLPIAVQYWPEANKATLSFDRNLDELTDSSGTRLPAAELRLRVGTNEPQVVAPETFDGLAADAGDTFATATDFTTTPTDSGALWTPGAGGSQSLIIDSEIDNQSPYLLDFPGGSDEPGNRTNRYQDNLRLGADSEDGTAIILYNFQTSLGVFSNSTLLNAITEQQKERVREIFSIYEEYLGARFVESQSQGLTIAVGDMRAIVPFEDLVGSGIPGVSEGNAPGGTYYEAGTLLSTGQLGTVLDIQDFNGSTQSEFGGPFQRAAMQAIGRLLGLGLADEAGDLTIQSFNAAFAPGVGTEIILPGDADIVHGQFLYRPDSKDIDLYQFALPVDGRISIETFAERMSTSSLLDSAIRLYQQDDNGQWIEIASNDDYFSSDSYLELDLEQGNYIVGVSSSGNSSYDPAIADSGLGGRSEGKYQLRLDFQPPAQAQLRDGTGVAFDGDADGTPEGVFNFWFRPSGPSNTKFVDKAAAAGGNGSIGTPFNTISAAVQAAQPGDVIRIVGNGGADQLQETVDDNLSYEIGFDFLGRPLQDGSTFDVPKDVSVMIDAGAILKLRRARIGVGSTSVNVDRSSGSLLVLGTPNLQDASGNVLLGSTGDAAPGSVYLTSINDGTLGTTSAAALVGNAAAAAGDWGGIDFRARFDNSTIGRENQEAQGQFMNWVSHAELHYGGGQVVVDGVSQEIASIQMVDARPTVTNTLIADGAGSAMAATPDSFLESNFRSPAEQAGQPAFAIDYTRVGPELNNNQLLGNAINALQVLIGQVDADVVMTVPGRFDDADVVHFLPENLIIQGTPGGAVLANEGPSSASVILSEQVGGTLAAGAYNYRFTTVDINGVESTASEPTSTLFTTGAGSIVLSSLPLSIDRVYRSVNGGDYELVAELQNNSTVFVDNGTTIGTPLPADLGVYTSRLDASLSVDPGVVVKLNGSRIDVNFGAQLIAEGTDGNPVIFTSLDDNRYGAGGTFLTANNAGQSAVEGDWGGIYIGHTSSASLDHTVVAYGGGSTRIEGGFADFNAIEAHQAELRLASSRVEFSAVGNTNATEPNRGGRGTNDSSTIFVRGAQPVIVDNIINNNMGPAMSINVSALNAEYVSDYGRATGLKDSFDDFDGNQGPLVALNRIDDNDINGIVVRGGDLTTEGVWDDTDIVHVVLDEIVVPDFQHYGGLRLNSADNESLVVKLEGADAGFTALGTPSDNSDRIGGSIQVVGNPDHPVVLTSLDDCSVGAGFTVTGAHQVDTNNTGFCTDPDATIDFVDVLVVMDESASMAFAQQFSVGFIDDLDTNLRQSGIGNSSAGPNLFGLVGFGSSNPDPRAIPVAANGDLWGTSIEYATAATNLLDTGAIEDGYQAIHFALDTYEFRPDAEKFVIIVSNEDRDVRDATLTYDNTLARLQAQNIKLEGILSAFFTDQNNNIALALDADFNAYLGDGAGGFTVSPNGQIVFGSGTTITDYIDMSFETGGIVGDINQIQAGGLTAESFGSAVISSIVAQAGGNPAAPGDWRSVLLDTHSNDRNVVISSELESPLSDSPLTNETPISAEFLGEIAPDQNAGDENRRLGFQVEGELSRPGDVDVYSFRAEAGTEIWLDIDRTSNSLDTVIELVDANGATLALSDNSFDEEADPSLLFASAVMPFQSVNPLRKSAEEFYFTSAQGDPKDLYSTNIKDAGMRVRLPGDPGASNLFHVRVRSSNLGPTDPANQLLDQTKLADGLSHGRYQLQIRLQEVDEIPGSGVNYADIRFATNGLELVGVPGNSALTGETGEFENTPAAIAANLRNDTFNSAQALGNLLESNRQAISVAGRLDSSVDVDWFSFDIQYNNLTPTALRQYFSTILDIDYADGIGRPDTSIYVFDSAGSLILSGLNSNLVDDQASPNGGVNGSGLDRGSFGSLDPYVGPYELPAGQYFVAITNSTQVPAVVAAYTDPNFADFDLRMQPIESIELIAEDHVAGQGGSTADAPRTPVLFPSSGIVDYNLSDVALYVSVDDGSELTQIFLVNPFTGEIRNQVGRGNFDVQDIDFRPNGQLRAFDRTIESNIGGNDPDTFSDYINIDPGTGVFTDIGDLGLETNYLNTTQAPPVPADANDGFNVEAIAFTTFDGQERGFVVANRPTPPGEVPQYDTTTTFRNDDNMGFPGQTRPGVTNYTNVLYEFDENTGGATSAPLADKTGIPAALGAGTAVRERGYIETFTVIGGNIITQASQLLAKEVTSGNETTGANFIIRDGDSFTVQDGSPIPFQTTYEFDLGPQVLTSYDPAAGRIVTDGLQFGLDGVTYEFDTGVVIVIDALDGSQLGDTSTVRIQDEAGTQVIFEFDNNNQVIGAGNVGVPFDPTMSQADLVDALVDAINAQAGLQITAESYPGTNRISLIGGSTTDAPIVTGAGLSTAGTLGTSAGTIRIPISEAASRNTFVGAISNAVRAVATVGYEAGRMNFSGAINGDFAAMEAAGLFTDLGTTGNVTPGSEPVRVLASDTAETVAARIAQAINDAGILGQSATSSGDIVQLVGVVVNTPGPLTPVGIAPGGLVTGIAMVGSTMFAVSDAGGLYRVTNPTTATSANVGTYIPTSYELTGIRFSGLIEGPVHVENGRLSQILFGIDESGVIHAFDTTGRLQPVFANGASSISTGLFGATGLTLSSLDFNLWHRSGQRGNDAGHGLPDTPNDSRPNSGAGGQSLYFGFENPGANNVGDLSGANSTGLTDSYNFPGGAAGAIESASFSLAGISEQDAPTLYFTYFFETEEADSNRGLGSNADDYMRDSLRVYASGVDGQWVLMASNNDTALGNGFFDDEFDAPLTGNPDVQPLFDNVNNWRQARVPLDLFAGQQDVRLRIEFSSHGGFGYGLQGGRGPEIRTTSGETLVDGETLIINGQLFELELGPTLSVPGGPSITNGDTISVEGINYIFTDGSLAVTAPDVPVAFDATMSADQVALALQNAIQSNVVTPPLTSGLSYTNETNDTIVRAELTGVTGESISVVGSGEIGDNPNVASGEDVDLVRIEVERGSQVTVRVDAELLGSTLDSYLRVFDQFGSPLLGANGLPIQNDNANFGTTDSEVTFVAPDDGIYYIGVSGSGNSNYNPAVEDTSVDGSSGTYNLRIDVQRLLQVVVAGNRVQLQGARDVEAGPPFTLQGATGTTGQPVFVNVNMTAAQVAEALRESLAEFFANGVTEAYPIRGNTLDLTGLVNYSSIDFTTGLPTPSATDLSPGPFGATTNFVGDAFGAFNTSTNADGTTNAGNPGALGAQNNDFEGVYLDDFIIGVAGRGEMVLRANPNTNFISDPQLTFPNPDQGNSEILVGEYQLELRGGEEYGRPTLTRLVLEESFPFDTRSTPGVSIRFNPAASMVAGQTFLVSDGTRVLTFEMDDVNDSVGIQAGNIALPFNTAVFDPSTGSTTSESAEIIAARFRDIINSAFIQAQLNLSANLLNNDSIGATSATVVLIGSGIAQVPPSVGQVIITEDATGGANRERPQGQVVINGAKVSNSSGFGITVSSSAPDPITGASVPGVPRNLITVNTENLVPGAVLQNNELISNNAGGINIAGPTLNPDSPPSGVPFVRVVNNAIVGGTITAVSGLRPTVEGGQVFDNGNLAFADAVVDYNNLAGGGPGSAAGLDDPAQALSTPNYIGTGEPLANENVVSLGRGGQLTLEFNNNFLTGSGDAEPDLMVFEVGDSEEVTVEVSIDGVRFTNVGRASAASPLIDIDAFGFDINSRIAFVRLTDIPNQGAETGDAVGADIDAVGALSSVPAESAIAGGTGITVASNSTATLLNNVIVNSVTAINVDASSASTVIGGTVYQGNTANVAGSATLGEFPTVLNPNIPVFVSAGTGNLYPAAGSPVIDASIDALDDRPSLVAVKQPLGIAESPILAPQFDINGQLRVNDPNVDSPSGLGENVFKDVGAQDRADFTGPSVVLQNPVDNDIAGADQNPEYSIVELTNVSLNFIDIRLVDGIAPSDPQQGVGIDHTTVNSASVLVFRNNTPLVEGIDYRFGYDSTNGVIRLQPLAGVWQTESVYSIRFVNLGESSIVASPTLAYSDGDQFTILDSAGSQTIFEMDLGYLVEIPSTDGINPDLTDGTTFTIDDGVNRFTFEFDTNSSVTAGNLAVDIGSTPTFTSAAAAIQAAIQATALNANVALSGSTLQITSDAPLLQIDPANSGLTLTGSTGVQTVFGLQIPLQQSAPNGVTDGQTFTIDRSGSPVTFELDTNGTVLSGNVPVQFSANATAAQIGAALVAAIDGAGLGLSPAYDGNGLVRLGGDSNTRLDLTNTVLTETGIAGQPAAVKVELPLDATALEVAAILRAAIEAQGLPNVTITQFGTRLILSDIQGIAGTGANVVGAIRDLAGNPLKPNQADGTTTVTVFIGEGFDYGDAGAPYTSTAAQGGPRHTVINGLSLGPTVTVDADAKLDNLDQDDGLTFSTVFAAFQTDATISVTNTTGQDSFVSLWIDYNGDGIFSTTAGDAEQEFVGRVINQPTTISFLVPSTAVSGDTFARIRISTDQASVMSPNGDAPDGEVEDILVTINGNPYTNGTNNLDVNGDGFVSPIDALQVVNYENDPSRPNTLSLPAPGTPPFVDVDGNGVVSARDTLLIVNFLNTFSGSGEGESGLSMADSSAASAFSADSDIVLASDWANGLENLATHVRRVPPIHANDAVLLEDQVDSVDFEFEPATVEHSADLAWAELQADDGDFFDELLDDLN